MVASQALPGARQTKKALLCCRRAACIDRHQAAVAGRREDPLVLVQEPVKLSDVRERTAPFSSAMGASMVATRTALSATKQVRVFGTLSASASG